MVIINKIGVVLNQNINLLQGESMKKLLIIALHVLIAPFALHAACYTPMYNVGPKVSQDLIDLYAATSKMTPAEIQEEDQMVGVQIASLKEFIAEKEAQVGALQEEIKDLKAQLKKFEIYRHNLTCELRGEPARIS